MLNGVRFKVWKYKFKICIQSIGIELWKTIIDDSFIPNHQINGEVKDKPDFLQTVEENKNFEIDFKTRNSLAISLDVSKLLYVYNCKCAKEM